MEKLDKELAEEYFEMGKEKYKLEKHKEAIEDFTKAIELNPQYSDSFYNRGNAKFDLGRNEEAITDYTKAIELNPQESKAYLEVKDIAFSSSYKEYNLYTNAILYLTQDIQNSDIWRDKEKIPNLIDEIADKYRDKNKPIEYFLCWLEAQIIKENDTAAKVQKYKMLYLLYFLSDQPYRSFPILETLDEIPQNILSPVDHYFFLQSIWQIIRPKKQLEEMIEDAALDIEEWREKQENINPYEKVFENSLKKLQQDGIGKYLEPSKFYPFYNNCTWYIDFEKLTESLEEKNPYILDLKNIDWGNLEKTLLGGYAKRKSLEEIFIIPEKEEIQLKKENYLIATKIAIQKIEEFYQINIEVEPLYKEIIGTKNAWESIIIAKVKDNKSFDIFSIATFKELENGKIEEQEYVIFHLYALLHLKYTEKKKFLESEGKDFQSVITNSITTIGVSLFKGISPTLSTVISIFMGKASDIIVEKYIKEEFPSLEEFTEEIKKIEYLEKILG